MSDAKSPSKIPIDPPGLATGDFGQHGSGPLDVADQRVRDDSVEFGSTHIETLRIADVEVDAACEILLARKARRRADEKWAAIDARDVSRKPRPAGYPTRRDTGATTKIDDRVGVIDAHRTEILIQHPHENRLPATHLKTRDDGVENGILELIGDTIGIGACRRCSPSLQTRPIDRLSDACTALWRHPLDRQPDRRRSE